MKKLLLLILLATTSCAAFSQTDTICVPRGQLRQVLKDRERLRVDSVERDRLAVELRDLSAVVVVKDERIGALTALVANRDAALANSQAQTANGAQQITLLTQSLRRQKRRTALVTIAGILVTGSLTYLLITK